MTTGLNSKRGSFPKTNEYDEKFPSLRILEPNKFNALIAQRGARLYHEKAVPCPNYIGALSSQQHDMACTICENSMIHYDGRELKGYFSTNEMVRNYLKGGFWEEGSAMLTVPSYYPTSVDDQVYISYYDRFTLLDYEDRFYEVLHKQDGNVDRLRYSAIKVEFIRTKKKAYEQDRDFSIDGGGNILWLTNNRPGKDLSTDLGEIFTISYFHRPVYRAIRMIHEGRFTQTTYRQTDRTPVRLPQQMLVKKDFIITKRDANGNPIPESTQP